MVNCSVDTADEISSASINSSLTSTSSTDTLKPIKNVITHQVSCKTTYKCSFPHCGKSFSIRSRWARHEKTHKKKYQCLSCHESFSKECRLRLHEQKHLRHADGLPFTCTWNGCTHTFENYRRLKLHLQQHRDSKMYSCSVCASEFFNYYEMVSHRKATHLKPYACVCGKAYNKRYILKNHIRKHHCMSLEDAGFCKYDEIDILYDSQELNRPSYICTAEGCGKEYKTNQLLRIHTEIKHLGLKRFECPVCNHQFGYKRVRDNHLKIVHKGIADEKMS